MTPAIWAPVQEQETHEQRFGAGKGLSLWLPHALHRRLFVRSDAFAWLDSLPF